ncbi:hypothetical protein [Streptomyces sp. WMMB 322]|uniref:hypothetical protein n=1 Tax=Streptomyces sp. WMMB 322 TaxID=1286821 RepID=UPI0006E316F7|nr:hypothetical protein [Streptomyces sp. WMMB 322]SCK28100.1 hypothetical protein H180DRAFT_02188 [Streptomyces sp. WMMB 322]
MSRATRELGFSWPALAAPRVVLHDLGVIEEGTFVNGLFVFVPPLCWIAAVLWRRPPRPFLTTVVVGAFYAVFLTAGHQLLWEESFGATAPALGGNLAGLAPAAQEGILRTAAAVSGIVTGTAVGAVTGAVAALLCRLVPDRESVGGPR